MTIVAPYFYCWARGETIDYTVTTLASATSLIPPFPAVVMAFVTGDGAGHIYPQFLDCVADMKTFVDTGHFLIISCGGAQGIRLEASMTEDQEFTALSQLLQQTGCRALDFDVEGVALTQPTEIAQRNKVIVRLQAAFPTLWVSFTIPFNGPPTPIRNESWALLQSAKTAGVRLSLVNGMVMDFYAPSLTDQWGTTTTQVMEAAKSQLVNYWPEKTLAQIYAAMGVTFMCGVNDDDSIFGLDDARILVDYVKQKGVGLLSYWALQRDQQKYGRLAISSQITQNDFDFYKICATATASIIVPTIAVKWVIGVHYFIGNIVVYKGLQYKCKRDHTSRLKYAPDKSITYWARV